MAVTIAIRRAQVEDARSIGVCLESAFEPFRSEYPLEAFQDTVLTLEAIRERIIHMTVYVAITPDGEIVGTLAAALHGSEGHLRGMAVTASRRVGVHTGFSRWFNEPDPCGTSGESRARASLYF